MGKGYLSCSTKESKKRIETKERRRKTKRNLQNKLKLGLEESSESIKSNKEC